MRVLVWQWGRLGAMPRIAMHLTQALSALPGVEAVLSLSQEAELLQSAAAPPCELLVKTYRGMASFALRAALAPFEVGSLARKVDALRPNVGVCVHPGPLDGLMVSALERRRLPFVALVHDPELHPGDGLPFQARLQRAVFQKAAALAVLTSHTAERVSMLGLVGSRPLIRLSLPPIPFPMPPVASRPPGSPLHVLVFGRLLEYKGLDILADALAGLGTDPEMVVRIVGRGNESPELQRLRSLPRVTVENRWVPEDEVGDLFGWCDAVVLPYTEASQSGVLATAIATGRAVLATDVGGLPEQLSGYARGLVCDPDAAGLLDGLRRLPALARDASVPLIEPEAAWREMAASLVHQIGELRLAGCGI